MAAPEHVAHIVIRGPGHDGTLRVLKEGITTFGRLPSNDIVLLGDLVSRQHSRITYFEGRATLQDLGSHNGSFVNGERVTTRVLKPGDKARVGNFQVTFFEGAPADERNPSTTASAEPARGRVGGIPPQPTAPAAPSASVLLDELQAARAGKDPDTRALRFVLRAADALASAPDLAAYMDEMLALALEQTGAQVGAYVAAGGDGGPQVVVARTPEGPVDRPHVSTSVVRWVISKAFPVKSENLADDVRFADSPSRVAGSLAVLCVPLGDEQSAEGAIYLSRPTPAFTDVELDTLSAVAHLVNTGLSRWSGTTMSATGLGIGRLFTEGAAAQIEHRLRDAAGGLRPVDGVVLRAGLFGGGGVASRSRNPAAHTHFYDAWCEAALSVLAPAGAEVRFGPGSGLTAIFGPGPRAAGLRALEAAVDLRATTDALAGRHPEVAGARLRAGLDQGRLLVGPVGGPNHVSWATLGDAVEVAGRLESAAPGGVILITDALRPVVGESYRLRGRGQQTIRGRAEPLTLHEVLG